LGAPSASEETGTPPREGAADTEEQLNARILACPLMYVRDEFGEAQVEQLIRDAGGMPSAFEPPFAWVSHPVFEAVLQGVRGLVASDQEFSRACAYKLKESYGPLIVLLRMSSIKQVYRLMASTSHVVSRVSRFDVVDLGRGRVQIRYASDCPESRLMCLSRQAQNQAVPAMWWGVPPPTIVEHECIAWGDPVCSYDLLWKEPVRWTRPAAAALGGVALGGVAMLAGVNEWGMPLLGLLGLALAWRHEQHRVVRENQQAAEDTSAALLAMTESHHEATRELIALHRRQQTWNQQLEHLVAARTSTLESVVQHLRGLKQDQTARVRSLSHDIRNPLTVVKSSGDLLRLELGHVPDEAKGLLEGLDEASRRIEKLLEDLSRVTATESAVAPSRREDVDVSALADTVRRRLRALVFGRGIRPTVFQTREAPKQVRLDSVLLDRVLDNLLTNAAKYTDRGSILVELDGVPGQLCVRISDTGRGISPERLHQVFEGTTPDAAPGVGTSLGLGLSVVVRTLAHLHGRLEVMSRAGHGTTFWLYLPVEPPNAEGEERATDSLPLEELIRRVIKIREAN
jgi:signal transduction histidine kinase